MRAVTLCGAYRDTPLYRARLTTGTGTVPVVPALAPAPAPGPVLALAPVLVLAPDWCITTGYWFRALSSVMLLRIIGREGQLGTYSDGWAALGSTSPKRASFCACPHDGAPHAQASGDPAEFAAAEQQHHAGGERVREKRAAPVRL